MDTPRSTYPAFSRADRRRLSQALAQARDARLYRRLQAVAEIAEGEPVAVVAKHARVERSTVYRWIERYLAERAPCSLADGKRSGRSRMTPALTHAVQQILVRVPVAAHLATYLDVNVSQSTRPVEVENASSMGAISPCGFCMVWCTPRIGHHRALLPSLPWKPGNPAGFEWEKL